MHNVPFYNKDAEYVDFSDSTTICKRLSPDLLVETYYVVCNNDSVCKPAFQLVQAFLGNNNIAWFNENEKNQLFLLRIK